MAENLFLKQIKEGQSELDNTIKNSLADIRERLGIEGDNGHYKEKAGIEYEQRWLLREDDTKFALRTPKQKQDIIENLEEKNTKRIQAIKEQSSDEKEIQKQIEDAIAETLELKKQVEGAKIDKAIELQYNSRLDDYIKIEKSLDREKRELDDLIKKRETYDSKGSLRGKKTEIAKLEGQITIKQKQIQSLINRYSSLSHHVSQQPTKVKSAPSFSEKSATVFFPETSEKITTLVEPTKETGSSRAEFLKKHRPMMSFNEDIEKLPMHEVPPLTLKNLAEDQVEEVAKAQISKAIAAMKKGRQESAKGIELRKRWVQRGHKNVDNITSAGFGALNTQGQLLELYKEAYKAGYQMIIRPRTEGKRQIIDIGLIPFEQYEETRTKITDNAVNGWEEANMVKFHIDIGDESGRIQNGRINRADPMQKWVDTGRVDENGQPILESKVGLMTLETQQVANVIPMVKKRLGELTKDNKDEYESFSSSLQSLSNKALMQSTMAEIPGNTAEKRSLSYDSSEEYSGPVSKREAVKSLESNIDKFIVSYLRSPEIKKAIENYKRQHGIKNFSLDVNRIPTDVWQSMINAANFVGNGGSQEAIDSLNDDDLTKLILTSDAFTFFRSGIQQILQTTGANYQGFTEGRYALGAVGGASSANYTPLGYLVSRSQRGGTQFYNNMPLTKEAQEKRNSRQKRVLQRQAAIDAGINGEEDVTYRIKALTSAELDDYQREYFQDLFKSKYPKLNKEEINKKVEEALYDFNDLILMDENIAEELDGYLERSSQATDISGINQQFLNKYNEDSFGQKIELKDDDPIGTEIKFKEGTILEEAIAFSKDLVLSIGDEITGYIKTKDGWKLQYNQLRSAENGTKVDSEGGGRRTSAINTGLLNYMREKEKQKYGEEAGNFDAIILKGEADYRKWGDQALGQLEYVIEFAKSLGKTNKEIYDVLSKISPIFAEIFNDDLIDQVYIGPQGQAQIQVGNTQKTLFENEEENIKFLQGVDKAAEAFGVPQGARDIYSLNLYQQKLYPYEDLFGDSDLEDVAFSGRVTDDLKVRRARQRNMEYYGKSAVESGADDQARQQIERGVQNLKSSQQKLDETYTREAKEAQQVQAQLRMANKSLKTKGKYNIHTNNPSAKDIEFVSKKDLGSAEPEKWQIVIEDVIEKFGELVRDEATGRVAPESYSNFIIEQARRKREELALEDQNYNNGGIVLIKDGQTYLLGDMQPTLAQDGRYYPSETDSVNARLLKASISDNIEEWEKARADAQNKYYEMADNKDSELFRTASVIPRSNSGYFIAAGISAGASLTDAQANTAYMSAQKFRDLKGSSLEASRDERIKNLINLVNEAKYKARGTNLINKTNELLKKNIQKFSYEDLMKAEDELLGLIIGDIKTGNNEFLIEFGRYPYTQGMEGHKMRVGIGDDSLGDTVKMSQGALRALSADTDGDHLRAYAQTIAEQYYNNDTYEAEKAYQILYDQYIGQLNSWEKVLSEKAQIKERALSYSPTETGENDLQSKLSTMLTQVLRSDYDDIIAKGDSASQVEIAFKRAFEEATNGMQSGDKNVLLALEKNLIDAYKNIDISSIASSLSKGKNDFWASQAAKSAFMNIGTFSTDATNIRESMAHLGFTGNLDDEQGRENNFYGQAIRAFMEMIEQDAISSKKIQAKIMKVDNINEEESYIKLQELINSLRAGNFRGENGFIAQAQKYGIFDEAKGNKSINTFRAQFLKTDKALLERMSKAYGMHLDDESLESTGFSSKFIEAAFSRFEQYILGATGAKANLSDAFRYSNRIDPTRDVRGIKRDEKGSMNYYVPTLAQDLQKEKQSVNQLNDSLEHHEDLLLSVAQLEERKKKASDNLSASVSKEAESFSKDNQQIEEHNQQLAQNLSYSQFKKTANINKDNPVEALAVEFLNDNNEHIYRELITDKNGNKVTGERVMSLTQLEASLETGMGKDYLAKEDKFKALANEAASKGVEFNADYAGTDQKTFDIMSQAVSKSLRGDIIHAYIDAIAKSGMTTEELNNGGLQELLTGTGRFETDDKLKDLYKDLQLTVAAKSEEIKKYGINADLNGEFIQLEQRLSATANALQEAGISYTQASEMPLGMVIHGDQGDIKVAGTIDQLVKMNEKFAILDNKTFNPTGKQGFQLRGQAMLLEANKNILKQIGFSEDELDQITSDMSTRILQIEESGTKVVEVLGVTKETFYQLAAYAQKINDTANPANPLTQEEMKELGTISPFEIYSGQTEEQIEKYGAYGTEQRNTSVMSYLNKLVAQTSLKNRISTNKNKVETIAVGDETEQNRLKTQIAKDEASLILLTQQIEDLHKGLGQLTKEEENLVDQLIKKLQEEEALNEQTNQQRTVDTYQEAFADYYEAKYKVDESNAKIAYYNKKQDASGEERERAELEKRNVVLNEKRKKLHSLNRDEGFTGDYEQQIIQNYLARRKYTRQSWEDRPAAVHQAGDQNVTRQLSIYRERRKTELDIQRAEAKASGMRGEELMHQQAIIRELQKKSALLQSQSLEFDAINGKLGDEKLSQEQLNRMIQSRDKIDADFNVKSASINAIAGKSSNFFDKLFDGFESRLNYFLDNTLAYKAVNKVEEIIRTLISTTVQLDSALVDIQIATGMTREETRNLMIQYNELADEMGRTTQEVTTASNDWLRAGYEGAEATELTRASMMLSTLGMINAADATTYLISTLKGWKLSADEVINVVDKLSAVDINKIVSLYGNMELKYTLNC